MNYYIQGDAANAGKIKAAFEAKGVTQFYGWTCTGEEYIFLSKGNELTAVQYDEDTVHILNTHPDYKELELPKPHYDIANFKPFDKVLVRDTENDKWAASLFSNFEYGAFPHKFVCIDTCYTQCIPFDGNEHLLGTTDMCDEQYINW